MMETLINLDRLRLEEMLAASAEHHHRVCPRQVLGVRIGIFAGRILNLDLPQSDKRLLAFSETDGCFVDGLSAATGCWVGRRTLRIEDYGKIAATFTDTITGQTIRLAPRPNIRDLAWQYASSAHNHWEAQLLGYQLIPDDLLIKWQYVELAASVKQLTGQPGRHVICETCGEEIINQREVMKEGTVLCKSCAGKSYFRFAVETK